MVTFGERLKSIRKRQNLTAEQMADKLSMSYSGYIKYEHNEREPKLTQLIKISDVLSVSVDYLLGINKIKEESIENWLMEIELSPATKREAMKNIWEQVKNL